MKHSGSTIAVITGTRAEFGLLLPVIRKIQQDEELRLCLMVTGSHLSHDFGHTLDEIRDTGIPVSHAVDILGSGEPVTEAQAISSAICQFSGIFASSPPDLVLVLGDRYEIFASVIAASLQGVPVAHISGGETTAGAKDEFFRHCITKMSTLHFPSTETYRKRIIQLGENPSRIFNAGSLGTENVLCLPVMVPQTLSDDIGFDVTQPFVLCTYHPETVAGIDPAVGIQNLLAALDALSARCLFTAANADDGGTVINEHIQRYCKRHPHSRYVKSLGVQRYLATMRYCTAVLGNSSSAIVEAPALHKPAVNIGDRQLGRMMGQNTLSCTSDRKDIERALRQALDPAFAALCRTFENPYGNGGASAVILREMKSALRQGSLSLKKIFYDIDFSL